MFKITNFQIKNFRCLDNFVIDITDYPVFFIQGEHGSGKSTILQAFDFIKHLFNGDINKWLNENNWLPIYLLTKKTKQKKNNKIEIEISGLYEKKKFEIKIIYDAKLNRCINEIFTYKTTKIRLKDDILYINEIGKTLNFNFEGSIFASLKNKEIADICANIANIKKYDFSSVEGMRLPSLKNDKLNENGWNLAGFIANFNNWQRTILANELSNICQNITDVKIKKYQQDLKELYFLEDNIWRSASEINGCVLKVAAIIASIILEENLILFNDFDTGLNAGTEKKITEFLIRQRKRMIVALQKQNDNMADKYIQNTILLDDWK